MGIISVTGTPGTGKSTFSKTLALKINYKYVDLNDKLMEWNCISEYDPIRKTNVIDINKAKLKILNTYSKGNYILDGHLSHLVISKKLITACFILRCSPYELSNRLKIRDYSTNKIKENCAAEILDIISSESKKIFGDNLVYELNSEKLDIVDLAIKILEGKYMYNPPMIDWLTLIKNNNDLHLFFD